MWKKKRINRIELEEYFKYYSILGEAKRVEVADLRERGFKVHYPAVGGKPKSTYYADIIARQNIWLEAHSN